MGYPVRYRSAARKYQSGGFQEPVKVPGRGGSGQTRYSKPPKPDNDNWPLPDNDNIPGGGRPKPPKLPELPPIDIPGVAEQFGTIFLPPQVRQAINIANDAAQFYEWFRNPQAYPEVDTGGWWTHVCGPVFSGNTGPYRWYPSANNSCGLGGQAGTTFALPRTKYQEAGWMLVKHNGYALGDPVGRWAVVEVWKRVSGAPEPYKWGPLPKFAPAPYAPYVVPEAMPATKQNPLPAIVEAPVGNEVPALRPIPATLPRLRPGYVPFTRPNAATRPQPEPVPDPGKGPVVVVNPKPNPNPVRRPPGPGVKERKIKATGGFAFMNAALHAASGVYEDTKFAMDIVNAFYNALPGKHDAKTQLDKMMALYRNWDKVDVHDAVVGVLWAVAGEKAGGLIERGRNTAARNLGLGLNVTIPTGGGPRI